MKTACWLVLTMLSLLGVGFAQTPKKPVLFIPLEQPELAVNVVKECPAAQVTYLQDKADFVVGWAMNEKENRNDWVVYAGDGRLIGSGETLWVSATAKNICKAISAK
jgi:hypothetical protein